MALWLTLTMALVSAPIVNQVVAVVEGAPITLWEVDVETRLRGLVQRGLILTSPPSNLQRIESLDQLINQKLAIDAAERFGLSWPSEEEVEAELNELAQRIEPPLDEQLKNAGIDKEQLRRRIRVGLRLRDFINRRLRDLVSVTDAEVRDYLKQHPSPGTDAGRLVREYLETTKLSERSRAFFNGLRERADVTILAEELNP